MVGEDFCKCPPSVAHPHGIGVEVVRDEDQRLPERPAAPARPHAPVQNHMRMRIHSKPKLWTISTSHSDCFRRADPHSGSHAANLQKTAFIGNQSSGRVFLLLQLHYKQEILRHDLVMKLNNQYTKLFGINSLRLLFLNLASIQVLVKLVIW